MGSVIPADLRRMLRAVEAGIDADGTYPSLDGPGRAQLDARHICQLDALHYYGFITGALTVTPYGQQALDDLRASWEPSAAEPVAEPVAARPAERDRTTCTSAKVRFATEEEGGTWLARYRAHKRPSEPRLRLYQCPLCSGWHVTKRRKWGDRKVKGSWS